MLPSGRFTNVSPRPEQNLILRALPSHAQARLFPHLELLTVSLGQCLHEQGRTSNYVYFPVNCIISMTYVSVSGASGQIALISKEGIVEFSVYPGAKWTNSRAIVQSPGKTYCLPVQSFHTECTRHTDLPLNVLRYKLFLLTNLSQTALCNRHHSSSQRVCRWLLSATDRACDSEPWVTQMQLASFLDVRLEVVTEELFRFQELGLIDYKHEKIQILNRSELERITCGCYANLRKEP